MNIFYKILVLVFLGGFTAALAQASLFTEFIAGFCGNELIVMTLAGAWMLGGAFAGTYLYNTFYKNKDYKTIMLNLAFIPVVNAFVLPGLIVFVRYLKPIFGFSVGTSPGLIDTALAGMLVMPLPGVLMALVFSLAGDVLRREKSLPSIKVLFLAEAAGFMMAGMLYTLFMSGRWGNLEIIYRFGLVNIAAAYILFRDKNKEGKFVISILIFVLIGYLSIDMTGVLKKINEASLRAGYGTEKGLEIKELATCRFAVSGEKGIYKIYQNGENIYSLPDAANIADTREAIKTSKNINSVLVINSAYSGILNELKKVKAVKTITVIEANAEFGEIVSSYAGGEENKGKNIKVIFGDPFVYFGKMKPQEKYNLVLISPEGKGEVSKNRFVSEKFKEMLTPYLDSKAVIKYFGKVQKEDNPASQLYGRNLLKYLIIGILLTFVAWIGFGGMTQQKEYISALQIMTTGAIAFTLMAIVILNFQAEYGTLFKDFGLLFGFFMFGAAFSAVLSDKVKQIKINFVMYFGALLSILIMVLISYFAKQLGILDYNFLIIALLLVGMFYGLSFNTLSTETEPIKLYGFNLLGGAAGGFLIALALIPAIGVGKTLAVCAVISFVGAVLSGEKKNG